MTATVAVSATGEPRRWTAPLLHNGDRLTRIEFERRYAAMPEGTWADLIEGIVYMGGRVRFGHGQACANVGGWIGQYVGRTSDLRSGMHPSIRLDHDNEPQPDLILTLPEKAGGSAKVDEDGYISGPPELVCEVAASSVSIDMHAKLNAYRRNGVKEYLVWRVEDGMIDWFALREGRYDPMPADDKGVLRSSVFPGLWLDSAAMLAGDLAKVFAAVDAGCATPEHSAFAKQLSDAAPAR